MDRDAVAEEPVQTKDLAREELFVPPRLAAASRTGTLAVPVVFLAAMSLICFTGCVSVLVAAGHDVWNAWRHNGPEGAYAQTVFGIEMQAMAAVMAFLLYLVIAFDFVNGFLSSLADNHSRVPWVIGLVIQAFVLSFIVILPKLDSLPASPRGTL